MPIFVVRQLKFSTKLVMFSTLVVNRFFVNDPIMESVTYNC